MNVVWGTSVRDLGAGLQEAGGRQQEGNGRARQVSHRRDANPLARHVEGALLLRAFHLELRDAEPTTQAGELLEVDRTDDVDNRQLVRLRRNDDDTGDSVLLHLEEDVDVLATLMA